MADNICDCCKRPMFNSNNIITGPEGLKIFVHKVCEDKWRVENKVDTYKFFRAEDKCIKCSNRLNIGTFCNSCGRCENCLSKHGGCKKVVLLGADE